MNDIKLKIEYSIESEIKRVNNTLAKIDWYKKNGYNPNLPINLKDVSGSVKNEYDDNVFIQIQNQIADKWKPFSTKLPAKLEKLDVEHQNVYRILLTIYGVKGSYNLPNLVIVNTREREVEDILRTIIHEIIHLSIENWIIEYKIPHWQKERLVDLIFNKLYPELNKLREAKENSEIVDNSFNKYYPDIEEVIRKI